MLLSSAYPLITDHSISAKISDPKLIFYLDLPNFILLSKFMTFAIRKLTIDSTNKWPVIFSIVLTVNR